MKILPCSDLHLEMRGSTKSILRHLKPQPDVVLVLAGDVTTLRWFDQAKQDIEEMAEGWEHVFWVLGNHEYYRCTPAEAWNTACAIAHSLPNVTLLSSKRAVEYRGKRFVGDTLWFKHDPMNVLYRDQMSDFGLINKFEPWVYDECGKIVSDFRSTIQQGDVVITHHMPSQASVHPKFRMSSLNRFFLCDVESIIRENKPSLWIHGHTHEALDYQLHSTRVVCNPQGYPGEQRDSQFNPNLIIEI